MKAVKTALIGTSAAVLLAVFGTAAASADPINFTWDPSATSGTALSTPNAIGGLSPAFTANNLNIADYGVINLGTPNGAGGFNNVQESAILAVTSLALQSPSFSAPGFAPGTGHGSLTGQNGASPYELYFVVNTTSTLSSDGMGGLTGSFTSLNYTLMGDVGGNCTFSASASGPSAACGTDTQLVLATGHLPASTGDNSASINAQGVPAANVAATVTAGPDAGNFFVTPSDLSLIEFAAAFTNTQQVTSNPSPGVFVVKGGGGNVDIAVPEPLTLSLFGAGLAGAAALRRRKSKKA